MGNFDSLSIVMGYMADHYAAANRGVALKITFSYAAELTNELFFELLHE
jgi:hypothetical protein